MKISKVVCGFCKKEFLRKTRKVNESLKKKRTLFCSPKCASNYRNKQVQKECGQCGKPMFVRENVFLSSKSGLCFCSRRCSCIYRNHHYIKTTEEKDKIRNTLTKTLSTKTCKYCGKTFHANKPRNIFCNRDCELKFKNGRGPYSKEEAIKILSNFVINNKTPPTSIKNYRLCTASKKYWGGWNKMIKELGYEPNKKYVLRKNLLCKDGHSADSISEMIVDDWLYKNNIKHERRRKYPNSKCNCDFYLTDLNIWMEYFGLKNAHADYNKKMENKYQMAEDEKIILIGITSDDIYPTIKIQEKLDWLLI